MTSHPCQLLLLLSTMLVSPSAQAQTTWYVDDDACPEQGSGTVEAPFCRIQDGIDAATAGDDVQVFDGSYLETIDLVGRQITLRSLSGPDATTIDGTGLGDAVVKFISGETSQTIMRGFTITGGSGNGLLMPLGSIGGGVLCQDSSPTIDDCTITGNTAQDGAGMHISGSSSPVITNTRITDNVAERNGGGVYMIQGANAQFIDSVVSGNQAVDLGGGMHLYEGSWSLHNCSVADNSSGFHGGGIWVLSGDLTISDSEFSSNEAGGDGSGGAINQSRDSLTITNTTFTGNIADRGGALRIGGTQLTAQVTSCQFLNNQANYGGAMQLTRDVVVTNCDFEGNTAVVDGGAVVNARSWAQMVNCRFYDNSATEGGAVHNSNEGLPVFASCSFSGNQANIGGGMYNSDCAPQVSNSILYYDIGGEVVGDIALLRYCCVQGGYPGLGVISGHPLFVNPSGGDMKLLPGSPGIDAGHNWAVPNDSADLDGDGDTGELVSRDLSGAPRFADRMASDDTGCGIPVVVDMGAYEYPGDPAGPIYYADLDLNGEIGFGDLLVLLGTWGVCVECCPADLNFDGLVSFSDLLIVLDAWG